MLFHLFISVVLANVFNINLGYNAIETSNDPETIFAGVIKNISRVNNVLQDLISNYEHLQKIYKSQENLDPPTSDEEIDEVYKSRSKKLNKESKELSNDGELFPATQIIWSDGENDNGDTGDEDSHSYDTEEETDVINTTTMKSIRTQNTGSQNFDLAPFTKKNKNRPREPPVLQEEPVLVNQTVQQQAEILFVDTHVTVNTEENRSDRHIFPELLAETTKSYKTRYNKVSHSRADSKKVKRVPKKNALRSNNVMINVDKEEQSFNNSKHGDEESKPQENALKASNTAIIFKLSNTENPEKPQLSGFKSDKKRSVQKVRSEAFSSKDIWDEIINNKPIQLQYHKDVKNTVYTKDASKVAESKNDSPKTTLSILGNKNMTDTSNVESSLSVDIDISEKSAVNDEFEANVLRKAYGDACLKVVIRKCYKACREAGKDVCRKFTCRSSLKSKFKELTKTGCLKAFKVKKQKKKHKKDKDKDNDEDKNKKKDNDKDKSKDKDSRSKSSNYEESNEDNNNKEMMHNKYTREGYLQACLPHIQSELRIAGEQSVLPSTPATDTKPTSTYDDQVDAQHNILRDKYEKECIKLSSRRCYDACKYSYDRVCQSFTCNSDKKKAFKRACKKQCKRAYKSGKMKSYGSSSSSSSSDSSSSSNSVSSDIKSEDLDTS